MVLAFSMSIEYFLTLVNLTSQNSPMTFPHPYQYYPCSVKTDENNRLDCDKVYTSGYAMPLFINIPLLKDNLPWAMYLGIDILRFQLNDIWFDYANLALMTVYFFKFGNPLFSYSDIKVSFSKTRSLEKKLREYTKMQDEKLKRKNLDELG